MANSIIDQQKDDAEFTIWGKTVKEIIDNDLVLITPNIETGDLVWVTRARRDAIKRMWEAVMPKLDTHSIGKILVYGTGGEGYYDKDLEKMFFNPDNYGFVEKREEESKAYFIPYWDENTPIENQPFIHKGNDAVINRIRKEFPNK